ncbi:dTMP kinase [Thorsellia anophelis]|uniref:Thymidylate kinase n=1 Tax=Thorsellia anophelis DSM 18579 TaxID=1123402 RepID=A0A1I0B195_9GAMM|nr:dTMP kinase [Thorsellia anophelis]SET00493.1 thymidylate kinase [Thorsellia anophelis DSM 18579]
MTQGKFIVVEGLEGAGKSNAQAQIVKAIEALSLIKGQQIEIVQTREPGGTPLAEKLRAIFKAELNGEVLTHKAELLVLYAARIQLVENIIKPALARGAFVIGDRHDLSSQAYQGAGRGFDTTFMNTLKTLVLEDFKPDLTLYLDIPPEIGLARARNRGQLDRIEQEAMSFFERVRAAYLGFAKNDKSIKTIDASLPIETVNDEIQSVMRTWLAY